MICRHLEFKQEYDWEQHYLFSEFSFSFQFSQLASFSLPQNQSSQRRRRLPVTDNLCFVFFLLSLASPELTG